MLPKPSTGSVGKLEKKRRNTSIMHHIPSKGNTQCLFDLIINKGFYEANHLNKKSVPDRISSIHQW